MLLLKMLKTFKILLSIQFKHRKITTAYLDVQPCLLQVRCLLDNLYNSLVFSASQKLHLAALLLVHQLGCDKFLCIDDPNSAIEKVSQEKPCLQWL